jgi:kinesin family protein 18/19
MEVYNELLYDLLEGGSGPLELREDPKQGAVVVGLKRIQVSAQTLWIQNLLQSSPI